VIAYVAGMVLSANWARVDEVSTRRRLRCERAIDAGDSVLDDL